MQVGKIRNRLFKRRGTCSHLNNYFLLPKLQNSKSIVSHNVCQDEDAAVQRQRATTSIVSKGSRSSSSWTFLPVRYLFLCRAKASGVSVDTRRLYLSCLGYVDLLKQTNDRTTERCRLYDLILLHSLVSQSTMQ
jgi:hypothetical protein